MLKIEEVNSRIQSAYSRGVKSDDSRLSPRHIYSITSSIRATLITNQIKKRQIVSDWNYIVANCIKMIPVNSITCKAFSKLGCTIYRSEKKIPRVLTDLDKHLIEWVMKVDNSYVIGEVKRQEFLYNKGNKYTKGKLKYTIENGYLFINCSTAPGYISMKFIPSDPIEAQSYINKCSEGDVCIPYCEMDFLLDREYLDALIKMSITEVFDLFYKMREDKTNDTSDSLKQESK